MGSKYAFFIGGSGARAFKAFLYACAAGAVHEREVRAALLDSDTGNAACKECEELYRQYAWHYETFHEGKAQEAHSAAFQCRVHLYQGRTISPVPSRESNLKMVVRGSANGTRALRWFYDADERKQDLSRGFYAHPNIGCIFFQNFNSQREDLDACLKNIAKDLKDGEDVRIAIIGSVFGGTGAAGIPNVLNLVREYCQEAGAPQAKLRFGGVLITPYFEIPQEKANPASPARQNLRIDSGTFMANTRAALYYYDFTDQFEKTYLVGKATLDTVTQKYFNGGAEQDNKPHIVEVFAAMAVKRFLEGADHGTTGNVLANILSGNARISWDSGNFDPDFTALGDMLRTQAVLETEVYPYLEMKKRGGFGGVYQWYQSYKMYADENQPGIAEMRKFTENYLTWMYKLQYQCDRADGENAAKDERVALCGDALGSIREYILTVNSSNPDKKTEKRSLKKSVDGFNTLVQTAQNAIYVIQKSFLLLSQLSFAPRFMTVLGASGLFLQLFDLASEKKN